MRELTLREVRLPAGGASQEFRCAIARRGRPRREKPIIRLPLLAQNAPDTRHGRPHWEEPTVRRGLLAENAPDTCPGHSPNPVPLRWLPPSDEWPGIF